MDEKDQAVLPFEVAEHRSRQREELIFKVLRHGLSALAVRGLRYLALVLTAVMVGWAQYDPRVGRTVNALIMAVVYVITLYKKGDVDAGN